MLVLSLCQTSQYEQCRSSFQSRAGQKAKTAMPERMGESEWDKRGLYKEIWEELP